jgi:hypothetical protein
MPGRLIVIFVLTLFSAAQAIANEVEAQMHTDVGKTFWVENPNGKGLPLCRKSFSNCRSISNTSFVVVDVAKAAGFPDYKVRLADGSVGLISRVERGWFLSRELTAEERSINQDCQQRGPSIGMTKDQVFTCMGSPIQINVTETADGKIEQMYYGSRKGFVYVVADKVTAIQSSE